MEYKISTTFFNSLNFNLKKIIFSFLKACDQRTIYWLNKKLRPFLNASILLMNIKSFKKCTSFKFNEEIEIWGILEIDENKIACWTNHGVKILFIGENFEMEIIKNIPLNVSEVRSLPIEHNNNIIYRHCEEVNICDKNFNLIHSFQEPSAVNSLCNISDLSFAVGLEDGVIQIYSRNINESNEKYEVKEYELHSTYVFSLLYLPKQKYLISGSDDINVFSLSDEKSITTIEGSDSKWISSLISLDDKTFASGSQEEIKIFYICSEIFCINRIVAHEGYIYLHPLGKNFMVSHTYYGKQYKIWDLKNYECIKTFKEDANIRKMKITKNNYIFTKTDDKKCSVWKISS